MWFLDSSSISNGGEMGSYILKNNWLIGDADGRSV